MKKNKKTFETKELRNFTQAFARSKAINACTVRSSRFEYDLYC